MADQYLKRYCVKEFNVWPYEGVESVTLVERKARVVLTADFEGDRRYRCYRRHPGQFVSLAPMEAYSESWEGGGCREISPYQLLADRPLAIQIEYVLFQSWKASDYPKLQGLIDNIKNGVLTPLAFPQDLRPARVILGADADSHPWEVRRHEGTQPPDHPTSAFIVIEHSDVPYINEHTVPEGVDYEFVQAAVVNYDFYKTPPTYDDLMKRLDKYCLWFEKLLSGTRQAPLKRPPTKRKIAKR
jgi:hypothetical protein